MALQDILPITSITLTVAGFLIILVGLIWMAHTITNKERDTHFSNAEDIIGEINQMFTYFTEKIDHKPAKQKDAHNKEEPDLRNEKYKQVLACTKQGKTPDQIAKELNMGKGEVNLILGIDQMR